MSPPSPSSERFRFRPRFRLLAACVAGFGVALLIAAAAAAADVAPGSPTAIAACGIACLLLPALYMASPTWSLVVITDEQGFEVRGKRSRRFRVAWTDVEQVVASRATKTCFVNGGSPDTSLMVPGEGAHAPYDIERRAILFDRILASVAPSVVHEVALLSQTDDN